MKYKNMIEIFMQKNFHKFNKIKSTVRYPFLFPSSVFLEKLKLAKETTKQNPPEVAENKEIAEYKIFK